MAIRIPKAIGLVACVVTTLIATQSPAHANPFPNNGDSAVADNGLHTYCYTSGFTTDASVASYAMSVLGNTTDMDDLFPIGPSFCQFMETDVWWFETNLPAETAACAIAGSSRPQDLHLLGHQVGLRPDRQRNRRSSGRTGARPRSMKSGTASVSVTTRSAR